MPMRKYYTVRLQCPYGVQPGQAIKARAPGGVVFSCRVPANVVGGQFFFVRVPHGIKKGDEVKKQAPKSFSRFFVPQMTVGNTRYFEDVRTCAESWCDCSMAGLCGYWARYTNGDEKTEIKYHMDCSLCSCCCFNWQTDVGQANVGFVRPATCSDQTCCAVCCPCCYTGDVFVAIFTLADGTQKFSIRRKLAGCKTLCAPCGLCCAPCSRCYNYCCTDNIFGVYEQPIYNGDINDSKNVAIIRTVDRLVHPCLPNELISVSIEPEEGANISEKQLALLSSYVFLGRGGDSFDMSLQMAKCGINGAMILPTGITCIDEPNMIESEWAKKDQALKHLASMS